MRYFLIFCFAVLSLSRPVHAAWHEASSEHFVIYANQSGNSVQEFAERLEKFHASMAFMLDREPESPSASNRITVFVVKSARDVRKLADINGIYTSGIYLPRAGNIIAVVPRLGLSASKFNLSPETILRHEYAHHFLFNITSRAFPLWFQEGFAEFYASGTVKSDGTVLLGGQAIHRAYELKESREVAIEQLLDTASYLENKRTGYDQFYGRSWLLYHYMSFEKSRQGQMQKFQQLMGEGLSDIDAAREAFGDLAQLDLDLDRYARRNKIMGLALPPDRLATSPVKVRELRDGEAAMMSVIMESRTGVDEKEAPKVVAKARKIATEYPDDAAVQEALAEAEFDAGFDDEAIAAADRALALDPKRVRAQLQKIYAYARRAESADDPEVAWEAVRAEIVAANRTENNHPIPLMEFYRAYRSAGQTPPDIAVRGLQRALELAPFDQGLRLTVAAQYMDDKQYETAAAVLRPLAYNPHRSDATEAAQKLLKLAEAAQAGDGTPAANDTGNATGNATGKN